MFKVYTRLQKLSISISKNAMYSLLSCFGNSHDSTVKKWMSSLSPSQVTTVHNFFWQSYNYNVVLYLYRLRLMSQETGICPLRYRTMIVNQVVQMKSLMMTEKLKTLILVPMEK